MRCRDCDKPMATQTDYDATKEGEGEHLCWSRWGTPCAPINWRASAETDAERLRDALSALDDAHAEIGIARAEIERLTRERDEARVSAQLAWSEAQRTLDEARAEVERLRGKLTTAQQQSNDARRERNEARAALRSVAERQREACADSLRGTPLDGLHIRVRATPLVTDES